MSEIVYLSLGSNLGDRLANINRATDRLAQIPGLRLLAESSPYNSRPIDCAPGSPDFVNQIIKMDCSLSPVQFLDVTEQLEIELGRTEKNLRASRIIDIDIILYGNLILKNERLEIPHAETAKRAFVLIPMIELDPDLVDPRTGLKFAQILGSLDDQGVEIIEEAFVD